MPRKETSTGQISAQAQQDLVSEGIENFELPKSLVTRIAKSAVPPNVKLQKETVLSLVKGSTVFINYLAATAHDVALSKQHKSISASDVLRALELIEFADLVDLLQPELQIYRQYAKTDKSKKGSTNINNASGSSATSGSKGKPKDVASAASASTKSKGKEKEKLAALPPPFTSVPLPPTAGPSSEFITSGPGVGGVAGGEEVARGEVEGDEFMEEDEGQEEVAEEVAEEDYAVDEEEEEGEMEGGEDEEMQDVVALEREELRQDAQMLEDTSPANMDA